MKQAMKTKHFAAAALVALALTGISCSKVAEEMNPAQDSPDYMEFTTCVSRTSLGDDGKTVSWTSSDNISIFDGSSRTFVA